MSKIKVIKGTWLPDVVKLTWKQRFKTLKPWIKYKLNNNAYFEGSDKCYVPPYVFKQLVGKNYDANIKYVHISELERICGYEI